MQALNRQNIILGITGGIAAYKTGELIRLLRAKGHHVRVVLTAGAKAFVTSLTLQALSGNPVHDDLLDSQAEAAMGHIALARWADAIIVAPASANFIARLQHGLADDLLTTLCLASAAPVFLAPAMNQQMWKNAATVANVQGLVARGVTLIGPNWGEQACGDVGLGRMAEPLEIEQYITQALQINQQGLWRGVRLMITAGPTQEDIDPVRYLTNRSSGKMGYALAAQAIKQGAHVTLITGPTQLTPPDSCHVIKVRGAREMHQAVMHRIEKQDVFIACAAVADYGIACPSAKKLKKEANDTLHLVLTRNPDIVAEVASLPSKPLVIGFAAETHDVVKYAQNKLKQKGLDMIIANRVGGDQGGFDSDNNAVILIDKSSTHEWPMMAKTCLAEKLVHHIAMTFNRRGKNGQDDTVKDTQSRICE